MPPARRLALIAAAALIAAVVSVALWSTRRNDGGTPILVDESTGSYRGVVMGDDSSDVRRRLGSFEEGPGFAPAGDLPAEVGVPQSIPGPGRILKYDDVAFLVGPRGVYAFIVTADGAETTRGVQIGDDLDAARRAYDLHCVDVAGGESLLGGQEFYPSCRTTIGRRTYVWFGRDPIRSITVLSLRHQRRASARTR
jgi:hypothetical protein